MEQNAAPMVLEYALENQLDMISLAPGLLLNLVKALAAYREARGE